MLLVVLIVVMVIVVFKSCGEVEKILWVYLLPCQFYFGQLWWATLLKTNRAVKRCKYLQRTCNPLSIRTYARKKDKKLKRLDLELSRIFLKANWYIFMYLIPIWSCHFWSRIWIYNCQYIESQRSHKIGIFFPDNIFWNY